MIPPPRDCLTSSHSPVPMLHMKHSGWYHTASAELTITGILAIWLVALLVAKCFVPLLFSYHQFWHFLHSTRSSISLIAAFKHVKGSCNKGERALQEKWASTQAEKIQLGYCGFCLLLRRANQWNRLFGVLHQKRFLRTG